MADLHFSTHIDAPREKVWHAMLNDATYREWTAAFMPGSYFTGDWSQDSKMLFLGPGEDGGPEGGMAALVKENRPLERISLAYQADIQDGKEVPWGEGGFENYTLEDEGDGTKVLIDVLNLPDGYADMFNDTWPAALGKLKEIAER